MFNIIMWICKYHNTCTYNMCKHWDCELSLTVCKQFLKLIVICLLHNIILKSNLYICMFLHKMSLNNKLLNMFVCPSSTHHFFTGYVDRQNILIYATYVSSMSHSDIFHNLINKNGELVKDFILIRLTFLKPWNQVSTFFENAYTEPLDKVCLWHWLIYIKYEKKLNIKIINIVGAEKKRKKLIFHLLIKIFGLGWIFQDSR